MRIQYKRGELLQSLNCSPGFQLKEKSIPILTPCNMFQSSRIPLTFLHVISISSIWLNAATARGRTISRPVLP